MLTDIQIRRAKPGVKLYRLADSGGLNLVVTPAGAKIWRLRYRFDNKEQTLTLGEYPAISLLEARELRDVAKIDIAKGGSPADTKKAIKQSLVPENVATFESVARDWYALNKGRWVAVHAQDVMDSLEKDVFPKLGDVPINEITAPQVLGVLRKIEQRPALETAKRVRQRMSAILFTGLLPAKGPMIRPQ